MFIEKSQGKNVIKWFLALILLFVPVIVFAQDDGEQKNNVRDQFFKAEVLEVIRQENTVLADGATVLQQNLRLKGLEGDFKGKEIYFYGIGEVDSLSKNIYKAGDKVLAVASYNENGAASFYVTDYIRTGGLLILSIAFFLSIFAVGRFKGLRAILSLVITFFIIIKYIIPKILAGADPLVITIIGSLFILLTVIYLTEGFGRHAHAAALSIFLSLLITIFISWAFVLATKLSGMDSEEILFLADLRGAAVNFQGLLLAGLIIGALGVLDDVVVSQVSAVEEIFKTDPLQTKKELFKRAYKIGVSHISSMTNTLFLAYAGASLPLLLIFVSGESAFSGWGQIINNEAIATEIVRTLGGSIGLILSVPISTAIGVWLVARR